jgi:hypothetical protein
MKADHPEAVSRLLVQAMQVSNIQGAAPTWSYCGRYYNSSRSFRAHRHCPGHLAKAAFAQAGNHFSVAVNVGIMGEA